MTVHGSVNHTLWHPIGGNEYYPSNYFRDEFVATYRFLNSSYGSSLGIIRRACNFNNGASDCDYGYRKLSPPPGNNSWALFEFTSASPPFWLLLQQSPEQANNQFGLSPGNPGTVNWVSTMSAFAFATAVREDGLSPWNGTTANNGSDTKGYPVWIPGSSRVAINPLNNGFRGQFRVDRSSMHPVHLWIDLNADRTRSILFHVLATEDSITFLVGNDGGETYDFCYFGSYRPFVPGTGSNYCFIATNRNYLGTSNTGYKDLLWPWAGGGGDYGIHGYGSNLQGATYGGGNSSSGNTNHWFGGIIDKNNYRMTRVGLGYMLDLKFYTEYVRLITTNRALGKQDVFNIPIFIDGREVQGPVGELTNIKYCHTLQNHSTIHGKKYAVFGRPRGEGKILTLWGGGIPPGRKGTVFGEQF